MNAAWAVPPLAIVPKDPTIAVAAAVIRNFIILIVLSIIIVISSL
jgi:hypothetical protein